MNFLNKENLRVKIFEIIIVLNNFWYFLIFNIKINRRYNSILTNKYLNLLYIALYKFTYLLKDMQFQIFIIIFFRFKIRFKIVIFPSYLSSTIREHTDTHRI